MDPVVQIEYCVFAQRRPNSDHQTSISHKIDGLLAGYACFNPQQQQRSLHHPCTTQARRPHSSSSWVRVGAVAPAVKASASGSSSRRSCCAISSESVVIDTLNKVTDDNYPRMLERILSAMNGSTASASISICSAVLRKCYQQDFFLHLYLRIVADILGKAQGDHITSFREKLSDFASNTIALDLLTSLPRHLGRETGYDGFCERAKAKRQLIGRARTTLGLIDGDLVPASRDAFFLTTVAALRVFCERPPAPLVSAGTDTSEQTRASDYDDDHADVAVEYLREFMGKRDERTHERMTQLNHLLDTHVSRACSLMCKFKLQGVIGNSPIDQPPQPPQLLQPPHPSHPGPDGAGWQSTTRPRQLSRRQASNGHCASRFGGQP